MKELDKNKIYDLSELTSEEWELLKKHLPEKFNNTTLKEVTSDANKNLSYSNGTWWCNSSFPKWVKVNAKELFYTLENVQVDCTDETKERIDELFEVVRSKDFQTRLDALTKEGKYVFFRKEFTGDKFGVLEHYDEFNTITYEKFMELFSEPKYEVKMIVEAPNEDKPKHYANGIDTFERMESNCTTEECLAFAKGNIDKYNFRTKGQDLEDYKKIISYANWAIKLLNKK